MHNRGLIYFIICILCFFIATSCSTEKRIQKAEVLLASEGKLPEICASRFPPKDSIVYRDSVRWDTLYEGIYSIDTVYDKDTVKVYVTLPAKIITKEVVRYKDVYRENTAKVEKLQQDNTSLSLKLSECDVEVANMKGEVEKWKDLAKTRWWFLWILLVIAVGITFRKSIFKLSKKFVGFP